MTSPHARTGSGPPPGGTAVGWESPRQPGPAHGDGAGPPGGRGPGPPGLLNWPGTWQVMLVVAVATFAIGLILLLWPHATVVIVAVLIGIALLVVGVLKLVQGLTSDHESSGQRAAYVIIGILAGLAGLYCLRHIDVTVSLLAFIVGLFWAMNGVAELVVAAGGGPGRGRGLVAVLGLVSLAAGLIVIFWPSISLTILVAVIGAWLMFDGVALAVLAWQTRRFAASQARPG